MPSNLGNFYNNFNEFWAVVGSQTFSRAKLKKTEYKGSLMHKDPNPHLTPADSSSEVTKKALPDVASLRSELLATPLDWVGMSGIEVPILVADKSGNSLRIPARTSAYVSLDRPEVRGIHMSRLFKVTQDKLSQNPLSWSLLLEMLQAFLESHHGLSKSAKVSVDFEAMILRPALKSNNQGWRSYPVELWAEVHGDKKTFGMQVMVTYSSTCPASAALARQLIQENFKAHFRGNSELDFKQVYDWLGTSQGINATPHSQRSFAQVRVEVSKEVLSSKKPLGFEVGFEDLIDLLETALQTPVQTVVKREDEQEFALRNGQNLMFCEDAARRIKGQLNEIPQFQSYQGEVRHVESLHPHDAVSFFSK
jgi:GTP cyclohydrolase I